MTFTAKVEDPYKTITVGDLQLTYMVGDNWRTIAGRNSDKIEVNGFSVISRKENFLIGLYKGEISLYTLVKPDDIIDPSAKYLWD